MPPPPSDGRSMPPAPKASSLRERAAKLDATKDKPGEDDGEERAEHDVATKETQDDGDLDEDELDDEEEADEEEGPAFDPDGPWEGLGAGLGDISWGDSFQTLRKSFRTSLATTTLTGRDPDTRALIKLPPAIIIPRFMEVPSMTLTALVGLNDKDQAISVDLVPKTAFQDRTLPTLVRVALRHLGSKLNVDLSAIEEREASWEVDGATVTLYTQRNDFIVSIHAPGAATTERLSHTHRVLRRAQWLRCTVDRPRKPFKTRRRRRRRRRRR